MKRYIYTEKDFSEKNKAQESLIRLLQPLLPFYRESGARLDIGVTSAHYEDTSVSMEAFARPLWGLIPFWAGGGSNKEFEEIYRKGLAAGADPDHPDYWMTCRDYDQKFCEMAAIAYGMLFAPEKLWDPLSETEKDNLTEWLWEINRNECCACNWQWFCIITNLALKVRGRRYSKERIESGLAMMEDYYDKGGWYNDGNGGEKDYYNPFVMVSYGMIYAMFMDKEEPERCKTFRERAKEFARDFKYWFADDGASIAYGRSMTYRFAQAAFFSIALLSGTEVLPVPVMKGLVVRHLVWWLNKPIYDNAGILTIGYCYPNLQMSESYNAPGSPYWALKAFAFLALPDDHPFWSAECAPLGDIEPCKFIANAEMIVQHGKNNVVALVPGRKFSDGHSHSLEKYAKFAYSSRFGFSIARSNLNLHEFAPDSTLSFLVNGFLYTKDVTEPDFTVSEKEMRISWKPLAGIEVTTSITPTKTGHIRIHTIESEYDCEAYDGGFAPAINDNLSHERKENDSFAEVVSEEDYCRVTPLTEGKTMILIPDPNTNLIATKTALPMAVYAIHKGVQTIKTQVDYL